MISSVCQPQQEAERPVNTFLQQLVSVSRHELNISLPGLGVSFEACQYGNKTQGNDEVIFNKTVRNCQKAQIKGDQFHPLNSSLNSAF